MNLNKDKVSV